MTDTITTRSTHSGQPGKRCGGALRRLGRSIAYDALLVPVAVQTMAHAVLSNPQEVAARWWRLAAFLERTGQTTVAAGGGSRGRVGRGWVLGVGLLSLVVGLLGWFLIGLGVVAVVRGRFGGWWSMGRWSRGHGVGRPGLGRGRCMRRSPYRLSWCSCLR